VNHQGVRYIGTCEMSQFPILFINGDVTVDRCMCTLIQNSGSFPDLQEELQGAYDSYTQGPPIPNDFRSQTPVAYVLSVCSSDLTPVNIGKIVKGSRGLFVSSTELPPCSAQPHYQQPKRRILASTTPKSTTSSTRKEFRDQGTFLILSLFPFSFLLSSFPFPFFFSIFLFPFPFPFFLFPLLFSLPPPVSALIPVARIFSAT